VVKPVIIGIESSCDDTSVAILEGTTVLSNVTAGQKVHEKYGGVVPELASRAHQSNIVPVVDAALKESGKTLKDLDAIAFTIGPGLLGSLLVGTSFAKSLAMSLNVPLIGVNHMEGHVLAHLISREETSPEPNFPFLCLTVSGGHSQIVKVHSPIKMEILGETIDDAAGEAFDKAAKLLGLPYPGGPHVDKLAQKGDATKYQFPIPQVPGLNYSFSGLKTSLLYFLEKLKKENTDFTEEVIQDICASYQQTIIKFLLQKLKKAAKLHNINEVAISGGVSANSELRKQLVETAKKERWKTHIPAFEFCTDNGAMIAGSGYFKYLEKAFVDYDAVPQARMKVGG
jgi:N6-L-threonylcarbamoyladenine synthase